MCDRLGIWITNAFKYGPHGDGSLSLMYSLCAGAGDCAGLPWAQPGRVWFGRGVSSVWHDRYSMTPSCLHHETLGYKKFHEINGYLFVFVCMFVQQEIQRWLPQICFLKWCVCCRKLNITQNNTFWILLLHFIKSTQISMCSVKVWDFKWNKYLFTKS